MAAQLTHPLVSAHSLPRLSSTCPPCSHVPRGLARNCAAESRLSALPRRRHVTGSSKASPIAPPTPRNGGSVRTGLFQEASHAQGPRLSLVCRAEEGERDGNGAPLGTGDNGALETQKQLSSSSDTPKRGAQLLKCISEAAEVSVSVLIGTELVQEAQRRHRLAPTSAAALGRLLMGTLLLAAKQGPGEVVQVTVSGRGPIGKMTALALDPAHVKGFVGNPLCDPPLNARGKLDVGAAVGPGVLTVVRTHPSWQQAYTGTVPIQTGEIAEDLAHYLAESEQVNSALGLGVSVGRDGGVLAAGGFLVQVLPLCSEDTLTLLERNISGIPAVSDLVKSGESVEDIAGRILEGLGWRQAGEEVVPEYGPCDAEELRSRMKSAIVALGDDQVQEIIDEQGAVEVKCEFCADTVTFSEEEIKAAQEEERALSG